MVWWTWSTPSLPSLTGPLWPGVATPDRVLFTGQIELNCILKLNWKCLKQNYYIAVWTILLISKSCWRLLKPKRLTSTLHHNKFTYLDYSVFLLSLTVISIKMDLALNNLEWLICRKTKTKQTKLMHIYIYIYIYLL